MVALCNAAQSMKEKEETGRNYTYSQMAELFEALEKASVEGDVEGFVRFVGKSCVMLVMKHSFCKTERLNFFA